MTPKRQRIYIETSVWSFYFADDSPERREATRVFFAQVERGDFEVFVSDLVLRELQMAAEPRRSLLLGLVQKMAPEVLLFSDEARALSDAYLREQMVPERYRADALHIAIAVAADADVILSWNFRHIVKLKTRRVVAAVSRLSGYREIEICTPEEVFDDAD